ncbi:MAG: hypothetical protein K5846_08940 [Bacteroidales bacterium]|nr:hypothetical protein [Bacteroidales bacterium]
MNRSRTYSPTISCRAFPTPPAQVYVPADRAQKRESVLQLAMTNSPK